jgi:hypothetical protein
MERVEYWMEIVQGARHTQLPVVSRMDFEMLLRLS